MREEDAEQRKKVWLLSPDSPNQLFEDLRRDDDSDPALSMLARDTRRWPSEGARAYLQGYLEREVEEDWAADYALAEAGITVVKRLVNCRAIQGPRIRVVLAPLHLVRGVGSPCRVVAIEEEEEA